MANTIFATPTILPPHHPVPDAFLPVRSFPQKPVYINDDRPADAVIDLNGYTYLAWWRSGTKPKYRDDNSVKICRVINDGVISVLQPDEITRVDVTNATVMQYPYGCKGYNFRLEDILIYAWS